MTWRFIKLVSNENYLELLNRSANLIQLSVSLRGPNNSEPVGKMESARILVDEELIRSYVAPDNLEIPGGNTWQQIKVEVGLGYCSAEDKCLNLHRKWYLEENMVKIMIAKGQNPDIIWTYTKGVINLRESLMIRSTSCPWAWTQSSRSTPTCSTHNLSFTSHISKMTLVVILTFYLT